MITEIEASISLRFLCISYSMLSTTTIHLHDDASNPAPRGCQSHHQRASLGNLKRLEWRDEIFGLCNYDILFFHTDPEYLAKFLDTQIDIGII